MNRNLHFILLLLGCIVSFVSCSEEFEQKQTSGIAHLFIKSNTLFRSNYPENAELDDKIVNLRILGFDAMGVCVSNKRYEAKKYDIIKHEIPKGTYNFVFLANEPYPETTSPLNGIMTYSDLKNISYPASVVNSLNEIPMSQEIKEVEVLGDEGKSKVDDVTHNPLELKLSRLATRIDIQLEANENLSDDFKGVTFGNIPAEVPLLSGDNSSAARNVTRTFTVDEDYFQQVTPTSEQTARGVVWVQQMTRFILPFSNFSPTDEEDKAVVFSVNLESLYDPAAKLKIHTAGVDGAEKDNYTLPRDAALLVQASVKLPFDLNITVSNWGEREGDWQVQDRHLNVSQVEADITDFNGARITFSSNLAKVHVLPDVYVGTSGTTSRLTDETFNDLPLKDGDITDYGTYVEYKTSRFSYTYDKGLKTGHGYMDILLDEYNDPGEQTFRLILSGEDLYGGKLQREITVRTKQQGRRFGHMTWEYPYVGVFSRDNETGERIITGQKGRIGSTSRLAKWEAWVEDGEDQVIISTTPSFDPKVGTDSPGDPEKYPVVPNEYKYEGGTYITGRGRIYFRVGWKTANPSEASGQGNLKKPRYATIFVKHEQGNDGWEPGDRIYVRQGEAADYVMRPEDGIGQGPLASQTRNMARKVSNFNLTANEFLNASNRTNIYYDLSVKGANFVEYPSQAGSLFQWYSPVNPRRAYNPAYPDATNLGSDWSEEEYPRPIWDNGTGDGVTWNMKANYELCPEGYHLPSDGYTNQVSYNGLYPNFNLYKKVDNSNVFMFQCDYLGNQTTPTDHKDQIQYSEWRQSMWANPVAGDIGEWTGPLDTYPNRIVERYKTSPTYLENVEDEKNLKQRFGLYADGYFDRRPIKRQVDGTTSASRYSVASSTAQVAYPGVVIFNPNNKASIFLPSAGRRSPNQEMGLLYYPGETGYYWTSSASAPFQNTGNTNVWAQEHNRWKPGSISTTSLNAASIRCVRD